MMVIEPDDDVDETLTHAMGSNVLAKWGRSWYLSHVCGAQGRGKFAVYESYCPVSKLTSKYLSSDKVRVFHNSHVPSRADFVKESVTFFFDGDKGIPPSTRKVGSINNEKNEFVCVRISRKNARGPNIDNRQFLSWVFNKLGRRPKHVVNTVHVFRNLPIDGTLYIISLDKCCKHN